MVKRTWPWLVLAAVSIWLAIDLISRLRAISTFTTDDAYITMRYGDHLASGYGIVWNPGESPAVEGYSNFLYVLISAATLAVGGDPTVVFDVLGIAAVFASCALAWWIARAWTGPLAAIAPAIVLTSYIGTVLWASSGLETSVYQCLALAAVALFVHSYRPPPDRTLSLRRLVASGSISFLVAITRPEGPLVGIAIGIVLAGSLVVRREIALRERVRLLVAFAAPFVVPYVIYFVWRLVHFEALLPNSVACKSLFAQGSRLVIEGFHTLALPYLVIALLRRPREVDARTMVLFLVPLGYSIILRDVDPIISYYNRHALAAWAFLVIAAVVALARLSSLVPRIPPLIGELAIVALTIGWTASMRAEQRASLEQFAASYEVRARDRLAVGGWLWANLGANESYVVGDCGLIPYVAHGNAIDVYCLNNRAMTHGVDTPREIADYVYGAVPAVLVVHSYAGARLKPQMDYGVFPTLVADPRFADYAFVTHFGTPGSAAHYWIYRRR